MTFIIRTHFLGPMGGLKIEGPIVIYIIIVFSGSLNVSGILLCFQGV